MISRICGGLESSIMAAFNFNTYESLGLSIHSYITDWIKNGKMDDVNFDVMVSALDAIDRLIEEDEYVFDDKGDLGYMFIMAQCDIRFKELFNMARPSVLNMQNAGCMIVSLWTLIFHEVFLENYSEFKDLQEKSR